jgi:hypothetical protein
MWGIRAIRVGLLLCGSLAIIAGSGCCDCCQSLWGTKKVSKDDTKDPNQAPGSWNPETGHFNDQPTHITPERIHGGIY